MKGQGASFQWLSVRFGLSSRCSWRPQWKPDRDERWRHSSRPGLPLLPAAARPERCRALTRCMLRREQGGRCGRPRPLSMPPPGLPMRARFADRAAAAVALDGGDAKLAAERAHASAAACEGIGNPVEAALARMLAGRALAEAGDRERAAAEFTSAGATFEACGAVRAGMPPTASWASSAGECTAGRAAGRPTAPAWRRSPSASSRSRA